MAIPKHEERILLQQSGNRCAFPGCRRPLTAEGSVPGATAVLGEMAHIVGASSPAGPRGDASLTTEERNRADNLILLCNTHHQLIDDQPQTYTVERRRRLKEEHARWVAATLGRSVAVPAIASPQTTETLHSTLLPVREMPRSIYSVPCAGSVA